MILLDKDLPTIPAERVQSAEEAMDIISKLEYELNHSSIPGIGLAGAQIGINKAVAIIRIKDEYSDTILKINLINPKLIDGCDFVFSSEGCLSFPDKEVKTIRYNQIIIENEYDDYKYYTQKKLDLNYQKISEEIPFLEQNNNRIMLDDLPAICVQHEMAHLLGLTMFDFKPEELGRNEECVCGSKKKNKKCCNYRFYNKNIAKLFNPNYRGV